MSETFQTIFHKSKKKIEMVCIIRQLFCSFCTDGKFLKIPLAATFLGQSENADSLLLLKSGKLPWIGEMIEIHTECGSCIKL